MGYSRFEIDDIQAHWGLCFPPDLIDLLLEYRPLLDGPSSFDWILSDPGMIQRLLDWPFDAFWFDVVHKGVWWSTWGDKPASLDGQRAWLKTVFARVPKLIPLFGHRFIPEAPYERGNPVFSVYQTDVIYYGANLQDWLDRERDAYDKKPWPQIKAIPFWSEAVERNNAPP
jgi:hypothetical protein